MTKSRIATALWGLLLIVLSAAALAYNLGALEDYQPIITYVAAGLLAAMGALFLLALLIQQKQWFYVIPGFSFLALGGIVYLSTLEGVRPEWLGALFLGGIALGFLVVFLQNRRERWWALLQAETILLIAVLGLGLGMPESATRQVGALLFGGFAASFFLVWLLSGERGRLLWALILAGALAIFAAVIFTSQRTGLLRWMWPGLLVIIGLYLLIRAFSKEPSSSTTTIRPVPSRPSTTPEAGDPPARVVRPDAPSDQRASMEVIEPEIVDGDST